MIKNALFPLQIDASDFNFGGEVSFTEIIIFSVAFTLIAAILIIVNRKQHQTKSKGGGGGGFSGLFSGLTLKRTARQIGLNNEQIKMLNYVFKTDGVVEPERSLANTTLLDRHFRRAYRIIEQSSSTEDEVQRKYGVLFSTRNILENSAIGGVANTRLLKTDTIFNINYNNNKFEVTLLSSKPDHLAVESPTTVLGSHVKIPNGTRLSVVFFTKGNKGYSFETRVTGHGNVHGQSTVHLAHSNQVRFLSQRRFRRRQATIACLMNLVYVEGSGKKQRLIVDKRKLNGTIADISVGGCSIKSLAPVQVGAKFKIEFMQHDTNVAALGQVLRTNRAGMKTTIHVKFLKVSLKSMNSINAYVYEYANE
jgi:c-di-GMP-binding flagellar brake protein YcgR